MRLEIKYRDGAARSGLLRVGDTKINLPGIIHFHTDRFTPLKIADIVGNYDEIRDENRLVLRYSERPWLDYKIYPASMPGDFHDVYENDEKIIVSCNYDAKINLGKNKKICFLGNLSSLYQSSRRFVENIVEARTKGGYGAVLVAPGIADAKNISLLIYMGIDIVDITKAILSARENILFFQEGNVKRDELRKYFCLCPACREVDDVHGMKFEDILLHNIYMMHAEIERIRFAISKGILREIVESRIANSPELLEKFRILNENFYEFLEERTPVFRKAVLKAVLRESLYYPEIKRYRERVIERYKKPDGAKILLLLPCSAKKPYSLSKSHRIFIEAIRACENHRVVHEVIITSPLGIVPRDIEGFYPASSYDIPVTGHWFEDEKTMIKDMLKQYLERNSYDVIVSHLPEELNQIVKEEIDVAVSTCIGSPTSQKSIDNLKNHLENLTSEYDIYDSQIWLKENLKSMLSFQFGREIAQDIINQTDEIKGRFPNVKLYMGGKLLLSFSPEKGMFALSLEGGNILHSHGFNVVEIENNFDIRGSILAPGVLKADENIRIEDEVIIVRDNNLCAVGTAKMSGNEMVDLDYGEAVKVRYHT